MDHLVKLENLIFLDLKKEKKLLQKKILLNNNFFKKNYFKVDSERIVLNLVFLDMLGLLKMWRHIKGYPANGQTTYTNSKSSKKNKLLMQFRLNQFYSLFGKKKRNIFPTLIQAEYNNRL